jgi:predicted MPP superfamily phosphohydrolase
VLTRYTVAVPDTVRERTLAVVSDLHGAEDAGRAAMKQLRNERPDGILAAGDLLESPAAYAEERVQRCNRIGLAFLRDCASLAPTFYALGNHEFGLRQSFHARKRAIGTPPTEALLQAIGETGVTLLLDRAVRWEELWIGGLSGDWSAGKKKHQPEGGIGDPGSAPDWLREFAGQDGYKILLCHQPERYARTLAEWKLDLAVAGHAHGGQWRLFGRGAYAPGQGILPRYTAGVVDGRLVISRGLGGMNGVPRIGNPPEVVLLDLRHRETIT